MITLGLASSLKVTILKHACGFAIAEEPFRRYLDSGTGRPGLGLADRDRLDVPGVSDPHHDQVVRGLGGFRGLGV